MRSLKTLLFPYDLDAFLHNHWTQRAIAIADKSCHQEWNQGAPAGRAQPFNLPVAPPAHSSVNPKNTQAPDPTYHRFHTLFSWQTLNHLLNFHNLTYPDLRLALNGKVLEESENARLTQWCYQGATLILNQIHNHVPALAALTAELRYDLGYAAQVNAYASFSAQQGFSCHYDTHDVFILQIEGAKKWFVFADTLKYPLSDQKSVLQSPPEDDPYLTCMLQPGDLLYIPRGHWHYAIAHTEPSLHLTVGIHCKTGLEVMEWVISELRQQEEWRKSLPLCPVLETESFDTAVNTLMQQFCERWATQAAAQYRQFLGSQTRAIAPYALPYQAGFDLFPEGIDTRFQNPLFQRVQIIQQSDATKIITAGKEVTLRGVPQSVIERLFSQAQFTGQDVTEWLPDYDWQQEIAPLLSRLVIEGILMLDTGEIDA